MDKSDSIKEIDSKIDELEKDSNIWDKYGVLGEKLSHIASIEIMKLSLERDDLEYGTHNLEILFYRGYIEELKNKKDYAKIQEIEEKIIELQYKDYIITNGFTKKLTH